MPQKLKLRGVEKQRERVGLRFINATDAVEYYVHALVSIEERASKLGIGIVQDRSNWRAHVSTNMAYIKQQSVPMSVLSFILNLIFSIYSSLFTELCFFLNHFHKAIYSSCVLKCIVPGINISTTVHFLSGRVSFHLLEEISSRKHFFCSVRALPPQPVQNSIKSESTATAIGAKLFSCHSSAKDYGFHHYGEKNSFAPKKLSAV